MKIGLLVLGLFTLVGCKDKPAVVAAPAQRGAEEQQAEVPIAAPTRPYVRKRDPDMAAPSANTMNGDPEGPKQPEFDVVQADGQRKVQRCLDAMPATTVLTNGMATIAVKFSVGNDGKPKDVTITTALPAEPTACAKAAIEGLAFSAFKGSAVTNAFTLSYSRAQPTPDMSK